MTPSQVDNLGKLLDTMPSIYKRTRWTVPGNPADTRPGYQEPKDRLYLDIGRTHGVWGRMYVDLIGNTLVTEMRPELRVTHAVEIATIRLWLKKLPKLEMLSGGLEDAPLRVANAGR